MPQLIKKTSKAKRGRGGLPRGQTPGRAHLLENNWTADIQPDAIYHEPGYQPIEVYADPIEQTRIDHWTWPYPPAQFRNVFLSAWDGNQLPGFHKHPSTDWMAEWVVPYTQQAQEWQNSGNAVTTGMSQGATRDLMSAIKQAWLNQGEGS